MPALNPLSAIASPYHTPSQMDLLSTHQTASHQSHTSNRQVQGSSGPAPLGHLDCKTCSHAPIPLTSLLIHPSSCLQPISNHQSSCRAKVGRAPSPGLWSSTEWGGNQSWISRVASLAGEHLCLAVPGCAWLCSRGGAQHQGTEQWGAQHGSISPGVNTGPTQHKN